MHLRAFSTNFRAHEGVSAHLKKHTIRNAMNLLSYLSCAEVEGPWLVDETETSEDCSTPQGEIFDDFLTLFNEIA